MFTRKTFLVLFAILCRANSELRLNRTEDGADFLALRFRRMQYGPGACNGHVWKLGSVTDLIIDPITLMAGEAASMDLAQAGFKGVRIMVESNSRNVRATGMITNTLTGETTTDIIMAQHRGRLTAAP